MDPSDARRLLTDERERVRGLREEAVTALQQSREGTQEELSTYDQHDADVGTEVHDVEVNEGLIETFDAELADIDEALRRVEDGTYGSCEHCGAPLPDERLEAVPNARFCTDHQPVDTAG